MEKYRSQTLGKQDGLKKKEEEEEEERERPGEKSSRIITL